MTKAEVFAEQFWEQGYVDPEGVHREFHSGMHGQKANFDDIPEDDPLFEDWVDINVEAIEEIQEEFLQPVDVVLGTANGANRPIDRIVSKLGRPTIGLKTRKDPTGFVTLTPQGWRKIHGRQSGLVVVVEDVGTTGYNSSNAATGACKAGAKRVVVLNTIQRCPELHWLDEAARFHPISHRAIIERDMPTLKPEVCRAVGGMCAKGWELIPKGQ